MGQVLRSYARDKHHHLVLVGTIPVPHSKAKRSPAERRDLRYLVRRGATMSKKEVVERNCS